jgi:hypothetical protein
MKKKRFLFILPILLVFFGFQIASGQVIAKKDVKKGRRASGSEEFFEPRGDNPRPFVQAEVSQPSAREAALLGELRAAKKAGDEATVRAIEKQLGWTAEGKKLTSAFSPTKLVFRENLANRDKSFQTDVQVSNPAWESIRPDMVSQADGTLWVVDEDMNGNYLDIYKSTDHGETWVYQFTLSNAEADPITPSIAVGEGSAGNYLFIAYVLDGTAGMNYRELHVWRMDLDTQAEDDQVISYSAHSPRICTESPEYDYWYTYIAYSVEIIGAKQDWYDIHFKRSTDQGANWTSPPTTIAGGLWQPGLDINFGSGDLYVAWDVLVAEGNTDIYARRSNDYGNSWDAEVALATAADPEYDPRVAAAHGGGSVVVAYTRLITGEDTDIQTYYSTDYGVNWSWGGLPWTYDDEKSVDLAVSTSMGKIHASFWRYYDIMYSWADYLSPNSWQTPAPVNEMNWADFTYSRSAITVNPTMTEEAAIAWTDWRGVDRAVYFDAAYRAVGPKDWTIMVYVDGDNNLEPAGIDDFLEMSSVGSNANINIVVQFDRIPGYSTDYGDWTTCHRFYVTPGMTPTVANAISDWGDGSGGREVNMADPQTLINFSEWAMTNYPANNYALVLWNHGGGWREAVEAKRYFPLKAVCWDDTSGGDSLTMKEVKNALATIEGSVGQPNILGFDACLMGMAEVGYEIRDHAAVMVGSEETEPFDGWPYDTVLTDLAANPSMSPESLACVIVNRYGESYGSANDLTQSAIDLAQMSTVTSAVSNLATLMEGSAYQTEIGTARANAQKWHWPSGSSDYEHLDLHDFADEVSTGVPDGSIQSAANAVKTQVNNAVICEWHGDNAPGANGMAIYFPACQDLDSDYNSTVIDFAADTQWDEFLAWYCEQQPPEHPCCNQGGPGCIDPDIEAAICAVDPYCCSTAWDGQCVEEVTTVYGDNCDCCEVSSEAEGCIDQGITDCVCAYDPYCCEYNWDSYCVDEVEGFGCGICAEPCSCDLDGSGGLCNFFDWLIFITDWGNCTQVGCSCDLNLDGSCNFFDWLNFIVDWGNPDCPPVSRGPTITNR